MSMNHSTNPIRKLAIAIALSLFASSALAGIFDDDKKVGAVTAPAPATAKSTTAIPKAPVVKNATPVRLEVFPKNIELTSLNDRQSMVAQVVYSNGITVDVTAQAQFSIADNNLIKQNGTTFTPATDGETTIKVSIENFNVDVPAKITNAAVTPPISFTNDVMPVFSKSGCNAGSCHGAARGKDGFRLSLYGFDPKGDYNRVTREMLGRRINLSVPNECLLITKATGAVPHSGGELFKPGTEYYNTLMNWLEAGAPFDKGPIQDFVSIEPTTTTRPSSHRTES